MSMQSIGGLVNEIIVFAVFVYFTLIVSGKVKLSESHQEKFSNLMKRRGTLLKIVAYGGTIIFAALVLIKIFTFENSQQIDNSNLQIQPRQWTKADKDAMTEACITNTKNSYQNAPSETTSLCECATEKFTKKYTYNELQELNKKPQQEQMDLVMPIIEACKTDIKPYN